MTPEIKADVNRNETGQTDYTKYIRFARVLKVYDADTLAESDAYGSVDLLWLDTLSQVNGHVSFVKPFYSNVYGCGIISMPCVNDIAACYVVQDSAPIILGFYSKDQFEAARNTDLKAGYGQIGYIRPLKSGEILIKGRSQSEIYLQRNGAVTVTVQDGSSMSTAPSAQETQNTEPLVERASASSLNTQVQITLGDDRSTKGDDLGYSRKVFSIETASHFTASVWLDARKGVLSYSLPIDSSSEIVEIEKVVICTVNKNGSVVVKREVTGGIQLTRQYKYFPDEVGENGATKNPCTLDFNNSFAYIALPSVVAGDLVSGVKLIVYYIAKKKSISIAGNKLGDLFVDARNIVLRAGESNSYLGLFNNGEVRLGGSHLELGDRLRGHIDIDKAGMVLSPGISQGSQVILADQTNKVQAIGYVTLFYISDDLPLFAYDFASDSYRLIDEVGYYSLANNDRCDILPRSFDSDNTEHGFTKAMADELIANYKAENNAEPITYGKLKVL